MRFPPSEDVHGPCPKHFGEFRLRFQVNVRHTLPIPDMQVEKGVVKLHGTKGRRDAMTERTNSGSVDGNDA